MNALAPFFALFSSLLSVLRSPNRFRVAAALLVMLPCGLLSAQSARPGLISGPVDDSKLVVLRGNTHPLATAGADRGAVPDSMPAERMLLVLQRSPETEVALHNFVESLHDLNSPNFHQWLTPAQFGAQWGAADADIATVTAWLESHGFTVKGPTAGRTAIEFSGTAGQVAEAFHTEIHTYVVNGKEHHANASDPQVPSALAPIVAGIASLNDFRPRSMAIKGPRGVYNTQTGKVHPDLTVGTVYGNFLYVGPSDAATIYDVPNKNLNPASSAVIDGTGATIAVIGESNIGPSVTGPFLPSASYRSFFGLAAKNPTVIVDGANPGETGDGAELEAYLDTEVANGIAPNANVDLYIAKDTTTTYGIDLAAVKAIDDNLADVLNLSFSECEAGLGTSGNQYRSALWEQAAAQGITVVVSTDDSGSAGCDDPDEVITASYGLQVNGFASTPYNVAIGGTDFYALGQFGSGLPNSEYFSSTSSKGTLRSALKYIPETPWNDSIYNYPPGPISTTQLNSFGGIAGGGGGKSNCAVGGVGADGNPSCNQGYAKPSWQVAPGSLTPDRVRDIPDLALFSGNGIDSAAWGICTSLNTDASNNPVTDCTLGSDGLGPDEFYITGVGGTSAAAPTFAAIMALVRQKTGERQGQADYVLYNLARKLPSAFHDVTVGNNSVPCESGTLNCALNSEGADFLTGYNAGVGYDLASGLGSVDASVLVNSWANVGLLTSTTTLKLASATVEHGLPVTASVQVTGNGIRPSGSVTIVAKPGGTFGPFVLNASGSTGNVQLKGLATGPHEVTANFMGSTDLGGSISSPATLTITAEPSITSLTWTTYGRDPASPVPVGTTPYGVYFEFTAHPYGKNSPVVNGVVQPDSIASGDMQFTVGGAKSGLIPMGPTGYAKFSADPFKPGSYDVEAAYSGDSNLQPSTVAKTLEISKGVTQTSLEPSTRIFDGKAITFTIAVTTESYALAPTGKVELRDGSGILATLGLKGETATNTSAAKATATITTSSFPGSDFNITAEYVGDSNYSASTSTVIPITVDPFITLSSAKVALNSEHKTGGAAITVTSKGGYAGTIKFTCRLTLQAHKEADPPECAMYPATATVTKGGTGQTQILIFGSGTKLPPGITVGANDPPVGAKLAWGLGASGAALAGLLLFGIPARRRAWRTALSLLLLLGAVAGFTACANTPKFISAGVYGFTVTASDSQNGAITASSNVVVDVQ